MRGGGGVEHLLEAGNMCELGGRGRGWGTDGEAMLDPGKRWGTPPSCSTGAPASAGAPPQPVASEPPSANKRDFN